MQVGSFGKLELDEQDDVGISGEDARCAKSTSLDMA